MGFLDRLFGRKREEPLRPSPGFGSRAYADDPPRAPMSDDEVAVERYKYMLRTAPPEQIEAAHAEAFERLTPDQRRLALKQLSEGLPENERPRSDDPRDLARAATRGEMMNPGFLPRAFGGGGGYGYGMSPGMMGGGMMGGGIGMGGLLAGGLLSSMAGAFIGTSIANHFFNDAGREQDFAQQTGVAEGTGLDSSGASDFGGYDAPTYNDDPMGDPGGYEVPMSNDDPMGDAGGDFGGGDFGGGGDF